MSDNAASQDNAAEMIPKARLDEVLCKLADAEKAKGIAETKMAAWQTKFEKTATELAEAKTAHEEAVAKLQEDYEVEKVFTSSGIDDPDVVELVRSKYAKAEPPVGEDGTPGTKPALADWFKDYAATKPAILTPYLKAADPAKPATPATPPGKVAPKLPNAGAVKAGTTTAAPPTDRHADGSPGSHRETSPGDLMDLAGDPAGLARAMEAEGINLGVKVAAA